MKYRRSTGLSIDTPNNIITFSNTKSNMNIELQGPSIQDGCQLLSILFEVSNPKYHKSKGRPSKQYKSAIKVTLSKSNDIIVQKTCSYCSEKGHNI